MPKKRSKAAADVASLLPESFRKKHSRLFARLDFEIRRKDLREFRRVWSECGEGRRSWGPFSARGDDSLALGLSPCCRTTAGARFHVQVEFQRDAVSPYARISRSQMAAFTTFLRRVAYRVRVASWREDTVMGRSALTEGSPFARLISTEPVEGPDGYCMRLSGVEASFQKGKEPRVSVHVRWDERVVTITESGGGLAFNSLDEVFAADKPLLALPRFQTAGPKEKSNGHTVQ